MTPLPFSWLFKKSELGFRKALEASWEHGIATQRQAHEEILRQAQHEHEQQLCQLHLAHEQDLSQRQGVYRKTCGQVGLGYEAELAQLKAQHEEALAHLRAELIQQESSLRETFAQQVQETLEHRRADHQAKVSALETKWSQEVDMVDHSYRQQVEAIRAEHDQKLDALKVSVMEQEATLHARQFTLEQQVRDVDDLLKRQEAKKGELVKANEELATQVRLLEAKAKPDTVWVSAFSQGYAKAWDTLAPLMLDGVEKSKATIKRVAIDQTLANLQQEVNKRALAMGQLEVREKSELLTKYEFFRQRRDAANDPEDKKKYQHYLTALEWALNGHQLPQDQTVPQ